MSLATSRPPGFKSAIYDVLLKTSARWNRSNLMPHSCAIAGRCSAALVEAAGAACERDSGVLRVHLEKCSVGRTERAAYQCTLAGAERGVEARARGAVIAGDRQPSGEPTTRAFCVRLLA